jgi:hypothetical protein
MSYGHDQFQIADCNVVSRVGIQKVVDAGAEAEP